MNLVKNQSPIWVKAGFALPESFSTLCGVSIVVSKNGKI